MNQIIFSFLLFLLFGVNSLIIGQSDWIPHSGIPTNVNFYCVTTSTYTPIYAFGDSGVILSSSHGNTWNNQTSGIVNRLLGCVSSGAYKAKLIAVGSDGLIVSSVKDSIWQSQLSQTKITLRAICLGNGLYIAVGDSGTILTSPGFDSAWSSRISGTIRSIRSVAYLSYSSDVPGHSFLAVGDSGLIITSEDGKVWVRQSSGILKNLRAVTNSFSLGKQIVAVGDSGTIITSPDGIAWTQQSSGTINGLRAIYCLEDLLNFHWKCYVAVGENGTILTSNNGNNWISQSSLTTNNLNGVTWRAQEVDSIIVVGDSGTILTSHFSLPTHIKQIIFSQNTVNNIMQIIKLSTGFIIDLQAFSPQSHPVSICIFNELGQQVTQLINFKSNRIYWNVSGKNFVSGIYIVKAKLPGGRIISQRILFDK